MARVQLVIPDADKARFVHQAQREGLTLSAWIRAAAHERLSQRQKTGRFRSSEELRAFFDRIHALDDLENEPAREPDWEEHLAVINESKMKGLPKP